MEPLLLSLLILIALISIGLVAVWSFFAFGGVRRNASAQVALGSYGLLLGLLFALVYLFPAARQTEFPYDDAYANNWVASGLSLWSGGTLLLCSLVSVGLRRWVVLGLVLVYPILLGLLVVFLVPWKWPAIALPLVALDVGGLLGLLIILTKRREQGQGGGQATLLAVGGTIVVALFSVFLGSYYHDGLGRNVGPPLIDGPVTLLSLALGLLIFFVCRIWSTGRLTPRLAGRQRASGCEETAGEQGEKGADAEDAESALT